MKGKVSMGYNAGYKIIKRVNIGEADILLGYNKSSMSPYVTWKTKAGETNPYWGNYFCDKLSAVKDFDRRVRIGT